jgi:hypothetical protein
MRAAVLRRRGRPAQNRRERLWAGRPPTTELRSGWWVAWRKRRAYVPVGPRAWSALRRASPSERAPLSLARPRSSFLPPGGWRRPGREIYPVQVAPYLPTSEVDAGAGAAALERGSLCALHPNGGWLRRPRRPFGRLRRRSAETSPCIRAKMVSSSLSEPLAGPAASANPPASSEGSSAGSAPWNRANATKYSGRMLWEQIRTVSPIFAFLIAYQVRRTRASASPFLPSARGAAAPLLRTARSVSERVSHWPLRRGWCCGAGRPSPGWWAY